MKISQQISGAVVLCFLGLSAFRLEAQGTRLAGSEVSRSLMSFSASGDSLAPVLSPDGTWIAFLSDAPNLSPHGRDHGVLDLFAKNRHSGRLMLISVDASGSRGGNDHSYSPQFSADGRWIVFASRAGNLVANDTNSAVDVFLRDMLTTTTELISVNQAGSRSGSGESFNPAMTPDGRFIVFESKADDLVAGDANSTNDIFVRDVRAAKTLLISANSAGTGSGSGSARSAMISADGRHVAFISNATNLVDPPVSNFWGEVYVRDVQRGATIRASAGWTNYAETIPGFKGFRPANLALSGDGHWLFFKSDSVGGSAAIFRSDALAGTNSVIATNATLAATGSGDPTGPVISSDGTRVAFQIVQSVPFEATRAIAVLDFNNGQTTRISSTTANLHSPALNADGRFLAFVSSGSDFTTNKTSGVAELYLYDVAAKKSALLSQTPAGAGSSQEPSSVSLSDDARLAAFQSAADDLVENDLNRGFDVFVRDRQAGATELISQRDPALPAATANGPSRLAALDSQARYLLFASEASDLTAARSSGTQIYLRDLIGHTNALVTVSTNDQTAGNGISRGAVLTPDGSFVAFSSRADDLIVGDTNLFEDVFVRDNRAATTRLASMNADGTAPGNGFSQNPSISDNGRFVAFESRADNLVRGVNVGGVVNVFARDLESGTNLLVSISSDGASGGSSASQSPKISPNGRFVIFQSRAGNLAPGFTGATYWFIRDLAESRARGVFPAGAVTLPQFSGNSEWAVIVGLTQNVAGLVLVHTTDFSTSLICTNCENPSISQDGSSIAFEGSGSAQNRTANVYVYQAGQIALISKSAAQTGPGNGTSTNPRISSDGRWVVFQSRASDLTSDSTRELTGIFLHDRSVGQTFSLSGPLLGPANMAVSIQPIISVDGQAVAFSSFRADVAPGDFNENMDAFVLRLSAGDSDSDGMDDAWEMTYFGNLSHTGAEDSDGDGATDLQEFKAGTEPIAGTSVLRVLTLSSVVSGRVVIFWRATPGKTYQVEYKNAASDGSWAQLNGPIAAEASTASQFDNAPSGTHRFYRVRVLD